MQKTPNRPDPGFSTFVLLLLHFAKPTINEGNQGFYCGFFIFTLSANFNLGVLGQGHGHHSDDGFGIALFTRIQIDKGDVGLESCGLLREFRCRPRVQTGLINDDGFIKNIPVELEEAATIDGCNMFQTFFLIVLPLLKGIMATVAVINVMWIWNDFLLPSLIINKNGMQTLPLRTYLFFGQFTKKWDLATAALVLCMIPIVIFYLSCQKHIVKGITAGVGK